MDLISVIVPVYNVEKYLRKCVDSIIAQTYTNLEIILVDDGSPDNCGKICDEYAEKDSRIRVIHQENGGLSAARNAGLDIATGDYIGFVDSDDYIDTNYFESMISIAGCCDMVSSVVVDENENGIVLSKKSTRDQYYSAKEALSEMCYERKLGTSACGKLIKKDIAKKHRFPVGKLYEDLFTVYKWYASSETIATTSKAAYHYVHRFGSISNNNWDDRTTDLMDAAENLLTFLKSDFSDIYRDAVYRYFFSANDFLTKAERSKNYKKIFSPYRKKLKFLWKDLNRRKLSVKAFVNFVLMIVSPESHKLLHTIYDKFK